MNCAMIKKLAAAPLFDAGNQQASRNPKIHAIRSDAYRTLLRSEGLFDLIVSEPSNPWVTGIEMLYSQEMLLELVRRHSAKPCPEIFDTILRELKGFMAQELFEDDICLVGVDVADVLP